jgi:hypothetical protein
LVQVFASTLQSLTDDATALQQLTSLAVLSGILENGQKQQNTDHQQQQHWLHSYQTLDAMVTALEDKVKMLGDICTEEHRALDDLVLLGTNLEEQEGILNQMLQATDSLAIVGESLPDDDSINKDNDNNINATTTTTPSLPATPQQQSHESQHQKSSILLSTPRDSQQENQQPVDSTKLAATPLPLTRRPYHRDSPIQHTPIPTVSTTTRGRRDSFDPRSLPPPLRPMVRHAPPQLPASSTTTTTTTTTSHHHQTTNHNNNSNHHHSMSLTLARVTTSEWDHVSRNIRGRIPLAVVNEALMDIESVLQQKFASSSSSRRNLLLAQQQQQQDHQEWRMDPSSHYFTSHSSSTSTHNHTPLLPWVTEEELRQSCAFFRSGESTARSILWMLRTLQRLKQLPARHAQVTYLCLTTTTTTSSNNSSNSNSSTTTVVGGTNQQLPHEPQREVYGEEGRGGDEYDDEEEELGW